MTICLRGALWLLALLASTVAHAEDFSGLYWVELNPTKPKGDFDVICVGGRGHLEIDGQDISGAIISDQLLTFTVTGSVSEFGDIEGGMALSAGVVASFSGRQRLNGGRGQWKTDNGCTGRWRARLSEKVVTPQDRVNIYQALDKLLCAETFVSCLSLETNSCKSALTASLSQCDTLIRPAGNGKAVQQIGQCISKHWSTTLRLQPQLFKSCIAARSVPTS